MRKMYALHRIFYKYSMRGDKDLTEKESVVVVGVDFAFVLLFGEFKLSLIKQSSTSVLSSKFVSCCCKLFVLLKALVCFILCLNTFFSIHKILI